MAQPPEASGPRRVKLLRRATRALLWVERASVALWPAIAIIGGFGCLGLLGLLQTVPGQVHLTLLLAVVAALGYVVWRARPGLRWPGQETADRRLERKAGLLHRPLAVLADRPSGSGAELWPQHQARALAEIGRLRIAWPAPTMAARDPRALRLLLLLSLTIGVAVAGPDASERLLRSIAPRFPQGAAAPSLEIRAWVAAPAFTGLPPVLLPEGGAVRIPADSKVTVSLTGGRGGAPSVLVGGASRPFDPIGTASFQAQIQPADGVLAVQRDGVELARWTVTVQPDLAPVVSWTRPPATVRGRIARVRLAWKATHAYGVASLSAEFRLRDRPAAPLLSMAIPLSGTPREAAGTMSADLTANPWAGLPVTVAPSGRDGAGLVGTGAAAEFILPARHFRQPGAQAIVAVRQMLALAPQDGTAAAAALRQAAARPELWPQDDPAPDTVRDIAARLEGSPSDAVVEAAQTQLWVLALRLEEGTAQRTADALRKAQQALHSALDPAAPPAARDKAEIARREDALERALQRHQEALAEQARRDPGSATPVTPQERAAAERKLQQLRDAANADRMDEARQRMAELDQMLDDMRRAGRSQAQRKQDEGREKGRAQLSVLQDLVRRQAGQIDRAESRLADGGLPDPNLGNAVPGSAPVAPPGGGATQRDHDRTVQLALRRVLGELMQQHGDLTGKVPKNLGDADAAMRDAAGALAEGHDDSASAAALRAVEALQQGGQKMDQQLARQFGQQSSGQEGQDGQQGDEAQPGDDGQQMAGEGQDGSGPGEAVTGEANGDGDGTGSVGPDGQPIGRHRDPFGRATREGVGGSDAGGDTRVPEEMERARGRAVQDELRRREAQRTRPQQELDYIGRLLKQD